MSSITINSNIAALNAQRRLGQSSSNLAESFTRLSSGLRINRAADDSAGLAISESLKTDQRVFNQGVRNISDGTSLLSIADGAVESLTNITIRLTELAEQAANGALSNTQRSALNEEAQALREEFFRISQTTKFNGRSLFDGNFGDLLLQAGFGAEGGIEASLGGAIGTGELTLDGAYDTGTQPYSVRAEDVNGDGNQDVVTVDRFSGAVGVQLGNGDGSFQSSVSYDVFGAAAELRLADLNSDGALDIVTAVGARFSVLLGNGDGSFASDVTYGTIGSAVSLEIADVNNDGIVDLISGGNASSLNIALGNGDGTFRATSTQAVAGIYQDIRAADVNGDGSIDLIAGDGALGNVEIMLGNGDGSFSRGQTRGTSGLVQSVEIGDVNGDGITDIVAGASYSNRVFVFLGEGGGTFQAARTFAATGTDISDVILADFNGDNVLDIAAASGDVSLFLGNGDGTFQASTTLSGLTSAQSLAEADFDEDGVYDLVAASLSANSTSIFIGDSVSGVSPLLDFSLETQAEARKTLPLFQQKLDQLASQRGEIGAFEARLTSALATTRVASENYASARSQITDADVAVEAARLVRNQILQQAGAAILAQANQAPSLALNLLT